MFDKKDMVARTIKVHGKDKRYTMPSIENRKVSIISQTCPGLKHTSKKNQYLMLSVCTEPACIRTLSKDVLDPSGNAAIIM